MILNGGISQLSGLSRMQNHLMILTVSLLIMEKLDYEI